MRVLTVVLCLVASGSLADPAEPIPIEKLPTVLDRPGATYVMAKDLSCNDSGILIAADNVTVDLGGKTLTYGTGVRLNQEVMTYNSLQPRRGAPGANVGHHGIYAPASPRHGKDSPTPTRWNTKRKGIVIRNGLIRHGDGNGLAYSDAVMVNGTVGCEIHDLTIEVSAPDSSGIIGGGGAKIHDCRIVHTGTHVSNRHQILAAIVAGAGSEVYNNTIDGGPQAGIKAAHGAHIHHNDIRHNATVTNCYGILGYGQKDVHAHHNLIISKNGRGIHISEKSSGWHVHHNYVEVRERANREYPKGLDTHGIKLETCRNARVHHNVVVSVSSAGGKPSPCNFGIAAESNNEIYENVFVARKVTQKEAARALYLVGADGTGTKVRDNVYFSNDRMFECYWTPGNNFTFRRCRFYRLAPEDKITTLFFWNAKPATDLSFVDCTFGPGVSPESYDFPKTTEDWPADAEYTVSYTTSVTVKADGAPVAGAKVQAVKNARGAVADAKALTANREGSTRHELAQLTVRFDAKTRKASVARHSPYTLRIDAGETGTMDLAVDPEKVASIEIDLKTGEREVTPREELPPPDLEKVVAEAKQAAGPTDR